MKIVRVIRDLHIVESEILTYMGMLLNLMMEKNKNVFARFDSHSNIIIGFFLEIEILSMKSIGSLFNYLKDSWSQ